MGGRPGGLRWEVCEEYELKRLTDAPEGDSLPYVLVPKYPYNPLGSDKWRTYAPLEDTPDLFLRFARLYERGDQIKAMVDWVHSYGVLGQYGETPRSSRAPQFARDFKESVAQAAGVLVLYEAVLNGDEEKVRATFLEEFPFGDSNWRTHNFVPTKEVPYMIRKRAAEQLFEHVEENLDGDLLQYALLDVAGDVEKMVNRYCTLSLGVEVGSHNPSGVRAIWNFKNLLGAMYLQMYWLIGAGGDITSCKYCGRIISLTSPLPSARKTRQDKKFCDNACRQRHHYHTKTKPRRQAESQ
jgi:hypothetical protein